MRATRESCRACAELRRLLGASCVCKNDRDALCRNDIEMSVFQIAIGKIK